MGERRASVSGDRLGYFTVQKIEQEPERGEFYYNELDIEIECVRKFYLKRCESLVALSF